MSRPSDDPSVENEPQWSGWRAAPDSSGEPDVPVPRPPRDDDEAVETTVWDEPGLSSELAGPPPPSALTYSQWLRDRIATTSPWRSWGATALVALAAGPFAVLGALLGTGDALSAIVLITVVGPVTEEIMKIALPLWVVERRPYLFRNSAQIALCGAFSGLAFAAIENVLYLEIRIPNPPATLVQWRWTVCVALHMGCSRIAAMGVQRVWRETMQSLTRPKLALAMPYVVTAIVVHGSYNALAILLEYTAFHF